MKLDHIGDFVTALPAAAPAAAAVPRGAHHRARQPGARARFALATGAGVDEFIEFEFFHARSGLGQKELAEDDLAALADRLAPYRFDLAIDLRKQLDTRDVLHCTGARFLAGFNHLGQFPWLDVALEWEGDRTLHRKRSHVSDDLLRLVDAIGTASDADRTVLAAPPRTGRAGLSCRPRRARCSTGRWWRCIPASATSCGNGRRSISPRLIDLLIEDNGVNVVLIGGRDEAELAEEVLARRGCARTPCCR